MALTPRDAIHKEDLVKYDVFIKDLPRDTFPSMFLDSHNTIQVDVHRDKKSQDIIITEHFKPSEKAVDYFEQERLEKEARLGPPP